MRTERAVTDYHGRRFTGKIVLSDKNLLLLEHRMLSGKPYWTVWKRQEQKKRGRLHKFWHGVDRRENKKDAIEAYKREKERSKDNRR